MPNPNPKHIEPPEHSRFKPGTSGNPKGRPPAGATVREWINQLAQQNPTEAQLRRIAKDKKAGWAKVTAANRMLRTMERPDLADFAPYLDGSLSLSKLRRKGVNTELVKKAKVKTRTYGKPDEPIEEVEREVELFDRAGQDFDRIMDRTIGKSAQGVYESDPTGQPAISDRAIVIDALRKAGLESQIPPAWLLPAPPIPPPAPPAAPDAAGK